MHSSLVEDLLSTGMWQVCSYCNHIQNSDHAVCSIHGYFYNLHVFSKIIVFLVTLQVHWASFLIMFYVVKESLADLSRQLQEALAKESLVQKSKSVHSKTTTEQLKTMTEHFRYAKTVS